MAAGIGKIKASWLDFAGELLEPMAILAAGGTKASAAWAGMRGVFLTKVLGPLGMVVGAATGFLLVTRNLVKEWRAMGIQSAKAIETLTIQFKPLLGSMELAKRRAREIFAFSVKTPFKFDELAAGNKVLEGLTRGALSGKAGMELVGDAAAVAGAGFEETARSIGRLYDGIMSGRPVGEAGMRLQELGLISGETRNQIEKLQASNAAGTAIWAVVSKDIERTKGAMGDLSKSLEGLEGTYEDTRKALEAGFGQGFMEGEKAGVKSATETLERMTPVATYLGEVIGIVANAWANLKAWVVDAVTSFPGFTQVATGAALAVTWLAATITAATGGKLAQFALGLKSAAQAQKELALATGVANAGLSVGTVVANQLTSAKAALLAVVNALKAGNVASAVVNLRLAATEALIAVRTNAAAAAQIVFRGAMRLTWMAVRVVTVSLYQMAAAMLATPAFWIAGALIAAAAGMLAWYNATKKAREEMEAYNAAAKAIVENMEKQTRAIRTVADLRKAEADNIRELTQAYLDLQEAQAAGNDPKAARAQETIDALKEVRKRQRGMTGKTVLGDDEVAREDVRKAQGKDAARARDDERGGRGESSALEVARERAAAGEKLRAAAEADAAEEKRVAAEKVRLQRGQADAGVQEAPLLAKQEELKKKIAEYDAADASTPDFGLNQALSTGTREELEKVEAALKRIAELKEKNAAAQSKVALESESELVRLREQIALMDEKTDPVVKQNAERRVTELEGARAESQDPKAAEDRARAVKEAEIGLAQARIDAETQVAALRLRGYERDRAMLDGQYRDLAARQEAMDEESYRRQREILDARRTALEREAGEKRTELKAAYELAGLARKEDAARLKGDPAKADALRAAQDKIKDEQTRRDAMRDGEAAGVDPNAYADAAVKEAQAARAQARAEEEKNRKLGRDGADADQGSANAEIKARAQEMQGQSKAAKKTREDAARVQDEILRREKQKSYREQGFGGQKADAMATQDVKAGQARRMMEELSGNRGSVIADSLAQVGGGGNVAGNDPSVQLQERMVKLLEEMNDTTKKNVEQGMR